MKRELVLGLGALATVLMGCQQENPAPAAAAAPPPPAVVVMAALKQDVPVYREWIGTTDGDVNAEIRPKIDGYLLNRLYTEGSYVKKGDALFEIDRRQFEAQLEQAKASQAQAQTGLSKAQRDVARYKPLAAERAVSQEELDNAVSAEQSARASVGATRAAVAQANLNLSWTKVLSPIDGIAGLAQQQVGDLVSPQTVLTTVSTLDPIRVAFQLSETEYLTYQQQFTQSSADPNQTANLELILSDGSVWPQKGRMLMAGRNVDIRTGTITALGLFPNPDNILRPGQYAKIRAVTSVKKDAVLVPQRAVNEMQGAYQVAVIGAENKAEIRAVKASERVGKLWVIDEGLNPGERVVVEGFSRVRSGTAVDPKEAPPETTPSSVAQAGR